MDIPSHAELVAQLDAFLIRQKMAPSSFGRAALGEPSFVSTVRAGRMPGLQTLLKISKFMRDRDAAISIAKNNDFPAQQSHRLNAEAR